ncbi:unnamed protein product [Rotaria socialis]|uniref:Uncharacterized protein n=1 Tax=Rotaria socialis TaxID=392032 RepID=A0A818BGF6_9BILA|nr:unnamed protein product [Rotaria socialis]
MTHRLSDDIFNYINRSEKITKIHEELNDKMNNISRQAVDEGNVENIQKYTRTVVQYEIIRMKVSQFTSMYTDTSVTRALFDTSLISCKEFLLSLIYTDLAALPGTTPTLSEDVVPKYSRPQSTRKLNNMRQIIEFNRHIKYAIEGLTNDFLSTYFDFQQDILKSSTNSVIGDSYNKSLLSTEF